MRVHVLCGSRSHVTGSGHHARRRRSGRKIFMPTVTIPGSGESGSTASEYCHPGTSCTFQAFQRVQLHSRTESLSALQPTGVRRLARLRNFFPGKTAQARAEKCFDGGVLIRFGRGCRGECGDQRFQFNSSRSAGARRIVLRPPLLMGRSWRTIFRTAGSAAPLERLNPGGRAAVFLDGRVLAAMSFASLAVREEPCHAIGRKLHRRVPHALVKYTTRDAR
jgi:hypothetical protein